MRRLTATTLLLLMLAGSFAPAALASATNPLPACCRAGGMHHCMAMMPSSGGTRFQGQSCPYRKHPAFSSSAAPAPARVVIAPADPHPFLHQFYPELFVSQGEQPHPERAPPPSSTT